MADALLIAGDLTRHGTVEEAKCFATEFGGLGVPVVLVLGLPLACYNGPFAAAGLAFDADPVEIPVMDLTGIDVPSYSDV